MKTPGVYIVDKPAFANAVVEVPTAVTAFIGYTETALCAGKSLYRRPTRINSMSEFVQYFGVAPQPLFDVTTAGPTDDNTFVVNTKHYQLRQVAGMYQLYYAMMLFYQNGGGPCYIVSVGSYTDAVTSTALISAIDLLINEQEPTLLLIPDAILLDEDDCIAVQQAALHHCGGKMGNRMAILDIWQGYQPRQHPQGDCIANFRRKLGTGYLDFACAYYPWLNTNIMQQHLLSYKNLTPAAQLQQVLKQQLNLPDVPPGQASATEKAVSLEQQKLSVIADISADCSGLENTERLAKEKLLHTSLTANSPLYNQLLSQMCSIVNLQPPAAAMAGIFTQVDSARGVWQAPANVGLSAVVSPAVNISHDEQQDLTDSYDGKSVNAIRAFPGAGTLVWGARTLDANSLDWRYINVRRSMIMLQESIRLALKAYVFESNSANTWLSTNSMLSHFLSGIWQRGGLAGASADDAFSVSVGLGETMTEDDIRSGVLRVTVLVALSRPAEFINITLEQQMQKT
uniref:Phage tail sheath protein FI n=1 Tax=Rheinheimera sp. BAL341 TaxID=1708203 RepID=A0A486XGT8_9GAMM